MTYLTHKLYKMRLFFERKLLVFLNFARQIVSLRPQVIMGCGEIA